MSLAMKKRPGVWLYSKPPMFRLKGRKKRKRNFRIFDDLSEINHNMLYQKTVTAISKEEVVYLTG